MTSDFELLKKEEDFFRSVARDLAEDTKNNFSRIRKDLSYMSLFEMQAWREYPGDFKKFTEGEKDYFVPLIVMVYRYRIVNNGLSEITFSPKNKSLKFKQGMVKLQNIQSIEENIFASLVDGLEHACSADHHGDYEVWQEWRKRNLNRQNLINRLPELEGIF